MILYSIEYSADVNILLNLMKTICDVDVFHEFSIQLDDFSHSLKFAAFETFDLEVK